MKWSLKHHLCESLSACVEVTYGYLIRLDLGGLVSYALKGVLLLLSGRANKESIFLICTLSARGITRDVYMEWLKYITQCTTSAKSWLVSNIFSEFEVNTLSLSLCVSSHTHTPLSWPASSRRGDPVKGLRHTPCPANGLRLEAANGIISLEWHFWPRAPQRHWTGAMHVHRHTHIYKGWWWCVRSLHHADTVS